MSGDPRGLEPEGKLGCTVEVLMEEMGCIGGKLGTVRGVAPPMFSEPPSDGVTGGKVAGREGVDGMEVAGGSMDCCP